MLANDPHLGFSTPGAWYEAHIKYGDYENYGYHFPLLPFPLIAHNRYKAWGLTMFSNDDMELYYETFHPEEKTEVMYKGEWVRTKILKETIKVKGEDDVVSEVVITPHGPIITDILEGYSGKQPVSLCWVIHQVENPILDVAYQMGTARTLKEFEKAISRLAAPGLNFSYTDHEGNIAWWAAARLPIRPPHVNHKEILDGSSGKDEILGYVPFEQNPRLINPESGVIVSANNKSTREPVGPISDLDGYWAPADRAARITELLSQKEKLSLEDLQNIQLDLKSYAGPEIISGLKRILEKNSDTANNFTEIEKKAYESLLSWDCENRIESVAASLFHFTTWHILKEALEKKLGTENFQSYCFLLDHWKFLKQFVKHGRPLFISETSESRTGDKIVIRAFKKAVVELQEKFGTDMNQWQWGNIHTVEYVHPVGMQKPLNLIFNIGPFPAPGAAFAVNRIASSIGYHDYNVTSGPSTRRLIDYGEMSRSRSVLPTGNSGNFMSEYYDDQAEMFLRGEYRQFCFTREQIEKNKSHEMVLLPGRKNLN